MIRSIRARMFLAFGVLVVAVSGFIQLYYPNRLSQELDSRLEAEARATTELLAYHLQAAVEFGDEQAILTGIAGALGVADARYVLVTDVSGAPLGAVGDVPAEVAPAGEAVVRRPVFSRDGDEIGHVALGMSRDGLEAERAEIRWVGALFGLLVAVVALAVAIGLDLVITRPLGRITTGVRAVARGELDTRRVPVSGRDEVAQLAEAFNHLADQLREKKLYLDNIFATMGDAVLVVDSAGVLVTVNAACCELLEASEGDLVGGGLDLWLAEGSAPVQEALAALEQGAVEVVLRAASGARIPVGLVGSTMVDLDGRVVGNVVVAHDLRRQKESETELIRLSRLAGMAEIATGVLHNIGNVLNSVNVSTGLVRRRVAEGAAVQVGPLADLVTAQEDLASFVAHDARGRMLPRFLVALARQVAVEREAILDEVDQLQRNVDHIKAIVATQQATAGPRGILERVSVAAIVDDAVGIYQASLDRRGVDVLRVFGSVPEVVLDRNKTLEILVNLVKNAMDAIEERPGAGQLRLAVRADDRSVYVEVADDGVGIAGDVRDSLFQHGFTTKSAGHGFGLHSAANAARELGGGIAVHSDGPGRGACFTVELPLVAAAGRRVAAR